MNLLPRSTGTCPTSQAPPWAPTTQNREGLRGLGGTSPASQACRGAGEPKGQPKAANIIIKQVSGATADPVSSCSVNYRAISHHPGGGRSQTKEWDFSSRHRCPQVTAGLGLLRQAQVSPSVHRKSRTPSSLPQTLLYVSLWWWGFCQMHGWHPSPFLLQPWSDCSFLPGAPASFSTWIILISPVSL